jgi:hypothetical protein
VKVHADQLANLAQRKYFIAGGAGARPTAKERELCKHKLPEPKFKLLSGNAGAYGGDDVDNGSDDDRKKKSDDDGDDDGDDDDADASDEDDGRMGMTEAQMMRQKKRMARLIVGFETDKKHLRMRLDESMEVVER